MSKERLSVKTTTGTSSHLVEDKKVPITSFYSNNEKLQTFVIPRIVNHIKQREGNVLLPEQVCFIGIILVSYKCQWEYGFVFFNMV